MTLEQRVEALEKEVAALKEQVSKLPKEIEKVENVRPKKIEVDKNSTEDIARDLMRQVNKLA